MSDLLIAAWWLAVLLIVAFGLPWVLKFLLWYYPWVIGS